MYTLIMSLFLCFYIMFVLKLDLRLILYVSTSYTNDKTDNFCDRFSATLYFIQRHCQGNQGPRSQAKVNRNEKKCLFFVEFLCIKLLDHSRKMILHYNTTENKLLQLSTAGSHCKLAHSARRPESPSVVILPFNNSPHAQGRLNSFIYYTTH